jgi:hypothetical protein
MVRRIVNSTMLYDEITNSDEQGDILDRIHLGHGLQVRARGMIKILISVRLFTSPLFEKLFISFYILILNLNLQHLRS